VLIRQRGISLIEALVAMAIMAFGMLAILGLQANLRGNSDISKQRSEAVRFAQERSEELRAFSTLPTGLVVDAKAYADIAGETSASLTLSGYTSSATFSRQVTVTTFPPATLPLSDYDLYYVAPHKLISLKVDWLDRNNQAQYVEFQTMLSRTSPEIIGAVSVAGKGSVVQDPGSRHRGIPPTAVPITGTPYSTFTPNPASPGVVWTFDNRTAVITQICVATVCTTTNSRLLSGYIRFADTSTAPTSAESENPPLPSSILASINLGVVVDITSPTTETIGCYVDTTDMMTLGFVPYYCAIPVTTSLPTWSGRALVTLNGRTSDPFYDSSDPPALQPPIFPETVSGVGPGLYRVCRYTTFRGDAASPAIPNVEHPLDHFNVDVALTDQNFLVIRAGSTSAFDCPDDNTSTPVNGRTWHHQPHS
jgi:type II secretory pathway pseudopilin PulG